MAKAVPMAAGLALSQMGKDSAHMSTTTNQVNPWGPTVPYLQGSVQDLTRIYLGNQGGGYGVGGYGGGYVGSGTPGGASVGGSGTPGVSGGVAAAQPQYRSSILLPVSQQGIGGGKTPGANSVLSAYGSAGTPMKAVSTFVPTSNTSTGGGAASGGSWKTTMVPDTAAINNANQMASMFQNMNGINGGGGQGGGGPGSMYGPQGYQPFAMGGTWDTANNEYMKTLKGDYLNNIQDNPYINSVINRAMGDVASRFEGYGRYGSGANADAMMQAAGELRYQDYANRYNQERAAQLAAMGNAPAWAQTPYQLNAAQTAAPYENIKQYLGLLSPLGAGMPTGTASSPYYSNPLGQALGAASTGVGLYSQLRNAGVFGGGAGAGLSAGAAGGIGSAAGAAAGAGGKGAAGAGAASAGGKGAETALMAI